MTPAPLGRGKGKPGVVGEFIVEAIVDAKGRGRGRRYLVKWQGYDAAQNTWEPPSHLHPQLIAEYESKARSVSAGGGGNGAADGGTPTAKSGNGEDGAMEEAAGGRAAMPPTESLELVGGEHNCALLYPLASAALASAAPLTSADAEAPPRPQAKHVTSLSWIPHSS